MNTQLAFAFGVLTMVAITMMIVIVIGMVKVLKQQNKILSLEKQIDSTSRYTEDCVKEIERRMTEDNRLVYDEIAAKKREVCDEIGHIHRHQSDVERNFYSEMNDLRNRFDRYSDDLRRELQSYTDSRADKLEQKLVGTTNSKQIIKN